jgi:ribose transport system permease protein
MVEERTSAEKRSTGDGLAWGSKQRLGRILRAREAGLAIVILAICVILSIFTSSFLTAGNMFILVRQISLAAIIAIGMTFVILTGGIDLSVGSTVALTSVLTGYLLVALKLPLVVGILVALAVGLGVGSLNGFLVVKTHVHSFVITLGMLGIARGVALGFSGGNTTSGFGPAFLAIGQGSLFGLPVPFLIVIVLAIVAHVVLSRTSIGRHVYFVGSNTEAAVLSAIKVNWILLTVFAVSGVLAALESIIETSYLATAQPSAGVGYELSAIGAVVIGGASLFGGVGTILGTMLGATLLGLIANGLVQLGVSSYWQQAATGTVIIIAVALNTYRQRRGN